MKAKLVIYDVSPYIYAAANVSKYNTKYSNNFPVGGIQYLMKYIAYDLNSRNDVVLCFDSKSFRKQIYPQYKAGRKVDYSVYAQLEFLYDCLPSFGITCHKVNGLEADDLIYNVMEANRGEFLNIEIRGTDYDLAHNIIRPNECFVPATTAVNKITSLNFSEAFYKDVKILYNTIATYKVFTGDKSDNIPPFTSQKGMSGITLYNHFCKTILNNKSGLSLEVIRSRKFLENYITAMGSYFTMVDRSALKLNMDLVFPKLVTGVDFKETCNYNSVNLNELAAFFTLTKDTVSRSTLDLGYKQASDALVQKMIVLGKELRTGEFAADRNKPYISPSVNTRLVNMKSF